ncbi:MAG: BolA family transcriptional regulator [Candidatus Marinimicrobia bacterium]|nr:BolA family transcriptional regulator [Candidatus Neomarinimicrobiota bacterium]MBL6826690.1 BolA family transcriptional regulator [Candidatus Neomarinimicrobiota bacterium]
MKLEELQNIISKKISDEIIVDYINVYDYTAQHENHATFEGNYHLSMTLVSPDFESMSLIERHQLVYKALDEYMHGEIHALTMKTLTPEEYKNSQK